jgi:GT2 family glycosyltransferase
LVIDQTLQHSLTTEKQLAEWNRQGEIRWIQLEEPSITGAMNRGLVEASCPTVLFVDDDIVPAAGLVAIHAASYKDPSIWAVVGQVLQPGQDACNINYHSNKSGIRAYMDFPFNSSTSAFVQNIMAGNLSVLRERALEIGGFDENFVGVAYRFETEFARRITRHGGKILYEPKASIRHLRVEHGGTRSRGTHMTSASPRHGVGDYYFALRQGLNPETIVYMLRRPFREVRTKFHLRHPWWIPVKLIGEFRALLSAIQLYRCGPRYMQKAKSK